ncbi:MAG: lipid-A-disaccharide synthase [Gammaproteobacteria bacterium]|nr:lipid-A-disaccharide synthase [Gammaproteobacteria bacterium]
MNHSVPVIAIVAGEASGDNLGAALISELRARLPGARFIGVPGRRMREAGCEALASSDELALMGLFEIIRQLPRLIRLRHRLKVELLKIKPDVFIGIDAPEFNLGLARLLKANGLPTVQYVSPQVWAWRQGRVRTIGNSVDKILCLLPFEPAFYREYGVQAVFVGHPLADQYTLEPDRAAARLELGLTEQDQVVAVLPGSRLGEVVRLTKTFAATAVWLNQRRPGIQFISPLASADTRMHFINQWSKHTEIPVKCFDGQSGLVLAAADVVLVASGTATLEALLTQRPMVVAYRLSLLTAFILKSFGLVKIKYFSQPNLLLGRDCVPEFFQNRATPTALGEALLAWLDGSRDVEALQAEFKTVHQQLRCNGASLAAAAVIDLIDLDAKY